MNIVLTPPSLLKSHVATVVTVDHIAWHTRQISKLFCNKTSHVHRDMLDMHVSNALKCLQCLTTLRIIIFTMICVFADYAHQVDQALEHLHNHDNFDAAKMVYTQNSSQQ